MVWGVAVRTSEANTVDDKTSVSSGAPVTPAGDAIALAYRPISAFAVAALALAILTVLTVVGFAIASKVSGRPILSWWVVLASAVAFGLAVTAGRQIRNSEGTIVGAGLASSAWWISLLTGAGYAAYLVGTDFAVRTQAESIGAEYIKFLLDGQPEKAFRLTRDPGQQRTIAPDDADGIRRRFGSGEYANFTRSEIARLARTWGQQLKVEPMGAMGAEQTPNGYKVPLTYVLRSPEGQCEMSLSTQGFDDAKAGERVWMINFGQSGTYPKSYRKTRLGRLLAELQAEGMRLMPKVWGKVADAGPTAIEPLIRLEGEVPPQPRKQELAADLAKVGSMRFYQHDPTKQVYALASIRDGVPEIVFSNSTTTALGEGVQTELIARVKGDELLKEIRTLSASNWEKEPLVSNDDQNPILPNFRYEFEPVTLNLRPSMPRDLPTEPGGRRPRTP